MAEKKITKVEKLNMIKEVLIEVEGTEMLVEFVDEQIEQIQAKAEKAKQRAAEKRAEGDALRNTIQSLMTNEWQSIDDIFNQIDDEEVTRSKITARLTQLIKAGIIEKEPQKSETGNKQMVYRLIEA